MSYTYLAAAGEESSAESFSDIPVSVLSKSILSTESLTPKAARRRAAKVPNLGRHPNLRRRALARESRYYRRRIPLPRNQRGGKRIGTRRPT